MRRQALYGCVAALVVLALAAPAAVAQEKAPAKKNPRVEIKTDMGSIVLELWPDKAPQTVQNFIGYVMDGFYDGTIIHRVVPGFVIQGGGYTPDLKGKATKAAIPLEAKQPNNKYTVAMARTNDPNSATSQFFINLADNMTTLDPGPNGPGYAVFGKVIKGTAVVDQIGRLPRKPQGMFNELTNPVIKIQKVSLIAAK
ncbi:MAG: peptidylprolyl isomerase [Acidobacteria bacterium]|nr:peptidylprolyl isomerase [Acidobacteriota bacterium]